MKAVEILNDKLRGAFIHSFQVGDTWNLDFGGYFLRAQNLISRDERILNEWLQNNYLSYQNAVDKEFISKCTIVSAHMRKEVTDLKLDDAYNLTICFENNSEIVIPTNETIVDWQWCLNETGNGPYQDYIVACFEAGEIVINEAD